MDTFEFEQGHFANSAALIEGVFRLRKQAESSDHEELVAEIDRLLENHEVTEENVRDRLDQFSCVDMPQPSTQVPSYHERLPDPQGPDEYPGRKFRSPREMVPRDLSDEAVKRADLFRGSKAPSCSQCSGESCSVALNLWGDIHDWFEDHKN